MPAVSVVIPVHNGEPFLSACLESVLGQTLQDIEIICVNDASADAGPAVLEAFAQRDSRISIINLERNVGAGPARNRGIDAARGEYCTFCDADDIYPPHALQTLHAAVSRFKAPVGGGNIAFADSALLRFAGQGALLECTRFFKQALVTAGEYPPLWMPVYHPRYMFALDFLNKNEIRYPAFLRGEDPPFLAHALCHADSVAVCPEVVYICRGARPGKAVFSRPGAFADHVRHIALTCEIYLEHDAGKTACFFLAQALEYLLSPRFWLKLSRERRRVMLEQLLQLVERVGGRLFELDYAPYPIDGRRAEKSLILAQKGLAVYAPAKIAEKLRRYLCA